MSLVQYSIFFAIINLISTAAIKPTFASDQVLFIVLLLSCINSETMTTPNGAPWPDDSLFEPFNVSEVTYVPLITPEVLSLEAYAEKKDTRLLGPTTSSALFSFQRASSRAATP